MTVQECTIMAENRDLWENIAINLQVSLYMDLP